MIIHKFSLTKNSLPLFLALIVLFGFTSCARQFVPLFQKAQTAYADKKYVEAIDAIHLALPKWRDADGMENKAKAYELLGKSYHKLKKIDKATDAFGQAIKLSDNTYEAAYQLGIIYLASSQAQLAAQSFQNALRMKNDDPLSLVGLGNAYYDLKQYRQAKQIYQRVLDTSPGVNQALEFISLIDKKLAETNRSNKKRTRR